MRWPKVLAAICRYFRLTPTYVLYELPFTTFVLLSSALSEEQDMTVEDFDDFFELMKTQGRAVEGKANAK